MAGIQVGLVAKLGNFNLTDFSKPPRGMDEVGGLIGFSS
jgi:hypothetical protein